ncbi:transmembrane protein 138 [Bactrocera tryoni]|uniref:transmembrane protein 138 n=1 Tax=Bactrocera tryoni TaxID=59916 RepID=UPI001A974806|nr:transmembrane protein 138 [Bactrocera tryoni]
MKLTLRRYSLLLLLQFTFLLADLFFNTFAHIFLSDKLQLSIVFYVTQDILIICEYVFFTFAVHSTCVYEVGGASIIFRSSKFFLITTLTYFILSATQHLWIVYNVMWAPNTDWSGTLTALAFFQRLVSFVYYYACKHTALVVSDPRYDEENIDWIAEQLSVK